MSSWRQALRGVRRALLWHRRLLASVGGQLPARRPPTSAHCWSTTRLLGSCAITVEATDAVVVEGALRHQQAVPTRNRDHLEGLPGSDASRIAISGEWWTDGTSGTGRGCDVRVGRTDGPGRAPPVPGQRQDGVERGVACACSVRGAGSGVGDPLARSKGFTKPLPSLVFAIAALASFVGLAQAMRTLPVRHGLRGLGRDRRRPDRRLRHVVRP